MHESFDFYGYAHHIRTLSREWFSKGCTTVDIAMGMRQLMRIVDTDLGWAGDTPRSCRIACGPGCGFCCVLNVDVLIPEAIAIYGYLRQKVSNEQQTTIRKNLQQLFQSIAGLDDEERLFLRKPCAFLDRQGCCLIHQVRPLLCRAINSTDPGACREAIAMVPLNGAAQIEMNFFHHHFYETVFRALGEALEEAGLDHRPRRLTSAILTLFANPELGEAFVSGDKFPQPSLAKLQ